MKIRYATIALILTALALFSLETVMAEAELTGHEIMDRVYNRPDGGDRKGVMTMTLTNKRGVQKAYTFQYYIKDYGKDRKSLLSFMEPESIRGTGFLEYEYWDAEKEDDRWLFLPSMAMEKRIRGESDNKAFMGSDFTYEDMGWRSVDEDTHKLVGEEKIGGTLCWVIESRPKKKNTLHSKWVSYVNKDNYIQMMVLHYDHGGKLHKRLTLKNVMKTEGYWTVYRTLMENVQTSHRSSYDLHRINYDTGLTDEMFRVENLKGYPIKLPPRID